MARCLLYSPVLLLSVHVFQLAFHQWHSHEIQDFLWKWVFGLFALHSSIDTFVFALENRVGFDRVLESPNPMEWAMTF